MERFHDKPPGSTSASDVASDSGVSQVGPYAVLAEIARGELSTVYLARRNGALGLPRLCALKRLKPALSKNPDWLELLLDEARLISGIRHTNIVGVLGVGSDAGNFVMMEYIEGDNLEALLAQAGAARHPRYVVPPFVDALHGLHALHTACDDEGQGYGIVHQAPRARHLQLGIDGAARVIDFSQMRAKSVRPSRARNDRLKVAYMAPEQALHPDGVDLRADIFIIGVSLWEALTGERLFAADTDEQTFQNLLHRRIPRPSEIGLRPPRCFDAICMRALERDPKNRYASAQEMARELRDMAQQQALYASPDEMGRWVRHLVGRELRARRKLAGQDALTSSSEIQLETPASGIPSAQAHSSGPGPVGPSERLGRTPAEAPVARLPDGLTALPSRDDLAENPYATGRIYGGSHALVGARRAPDDDKTPAFGLRRSQPPAQPEPDDDEPTGQHVGSGVNHLLAQDAHEARARAATLPLANGADSSVVTRPWVPLSDADTAPPRSSSAETSSSRPAVPSSAPRSGMFGSSGTSSALKVAREDNSALRMDDDEQTQPSQFVPARPGARRDRLAASPGAYSQVDASRRAQRKGASEAPAAPAKAAFDEEAATERRSLAPAARVPSFFPDAGPDASQPGAIAGAARASGSSSDALPAPERRPAITEHPPMYIQRRDSSPTRLEIPEGPIGAPHRAFLPELTPRGTAAQTDVEWPGLQPPVVLPDSLTPPQTATQTDLPSYTAPRSSTLWLLSGVIAALVVLGVGVGLKHWRDRSAAVSATPPGVRPATIASPPEAPAQPEPPPAPLAEESVREEVSAPREAAAPARPAAPPAIVTPATPKPVRPAPKLQTKPSTESAEQPATPEVAPKRPAARKVVGLPDNPY